MFKFNFSQSAEKPNAPFVLLFIAAIAVIFIAVNAYLLFAQQGNSPAVQTDGNAQNAPRPIYLYAAECTSCFALDRFAQQLLTNAERVSLSESRGKELIDKYQITKLPAIIAFGVSQEQLALGAFKQKQDAYVMETFSAPFFDVASKAIKGNVTAYVVLPEDCPLCMNATALVSEINATGILLSPTFVTQGAPLASELIATHQLVFLPAFVFSRDLLDYKSNSVLATLTPGATYANTIESISRVNNNYLVVTQPFPPFVNLTTSKVEGVVEVVYLTNGNCTVCYDAAIHKNAIRNFNVRIANETSIDISTLAGQALVSKYNITLVPTLLMSSEAKVYSSLVKTWEAIGSVESDGWLVFRNFSALGKVNYTFVNGTIITAAP